MIAAKAFDPVLGVDIHIIQPPGPVPPVPVPHPFIGILIDPFDFAPIIGSTVSVNGLPRATAGTGGKCLPPHIPIGGVFVKPPANECDVFMGSSTVLADGEPLSFGGSVGCEFDERVVEPLQVHSLSVGAGSWSRFTVGRLPPRRCSTGRSPPCPGCRPTSGPLPG